MSQIPTVAVGAVLCAFPAVLASLWIRGGAERLAEAEAAEAEQPAVAVAQADERGYCTPALKTVLRRVLTSCGLVGSEGGRGCQPTSASSIASMSDEDFNALFLPLADRAAIVQFDQSSAELDVADRALVEDIFAKRGGASWFLVVSRASPEGSTAANSTLSEARGRAVLDHLQQTFQDPDLEREVGLLWLGEEYAQLGADFCAWSRSGGEGCSDADLNRSAFMTWIDCRI